MSGNHPNPAMDAVIRALSPALVQKVQPPDGIVMVLVDGSRWAVSAYRLPDQGETVNEVFFLDHHGPVFGQ